MPVLFAQRPSCLALAVIFFICVTPEASWSQHDTEEQDLNDLQTKDHVAILTEELQQTISATNHLAKNGFIFDRKPEGKRIGSIYTHVQPVFDEHDLFPDFPNAIHAETKPYVIAQELLFHPNDPFEWRKLHETVRNLKNLFIFARVLIVPIVAKDSGSVDIAIFVQDLWSLRLEQEIQLESLDYLQYAFLSLVERNFLGTNKTLAAYIEADPATLSLGQYSVSSRIKGTNLALSQNGSLVFRRHDMGYLESRSKWEGGDAAISLSKPLRNLDDPYGYGLSSSFASSFRRSFIADNLRLRDVKISSTTLQIPELYHARTASLVAHASRSFGSRTTLKNNITLSLNVLDRRFTSQAEVFPESAPSDTRKAYDAQILPYTERQIYPSLSWNSFNPDYRRFLNLQTFNTTEYVQFGYSTELQVDIARKEWLSTNDFTRFSWTYGYRNELLQSIYNISVAASTRIQDEQLYSRSLGFQYKHISPTLLQGRFHLRMHYALLGNDINNGYLSVGGSDSGLRGIVPGGIIGSKRYIVNAEYRSLPLYVAGATLGGVVFHDAGNAFDSLSSPGCKASVGVGARVLLSQFNTVPMRIDLAYPYRREGAAGAFFSLQWDQVF